MPQRYCAPRPFRREVLEAVAARSHPSTVVQLADDVPLRLRHGEPDPTPRWADVGYALRRLARDGLVCVIFHDRRGRARYAVTAAGKAYLRRPADDVITAEDLGIRTETRRGRLG